MKASEFFKHVLLAVTCLVGFCAFLIMAGEEDPCEPMPTASAIADGGDDLPF